MLLKKEIDQYILEVVSQVQHTMQDLFGDKLRKVILYGSYARGEQDEYSDMDIMIIVDMDTKALQKYDDEVFERTYAITREYNILLSAITVSYSHFYKWIDILPFYQNIRTEGIDVYAG